MTSKRSLEISLIGEPSIIRQQIQHLSSAGNFWCHQSAIMGW